MNFDSMTFCVLVILVVLWVVVYILEAVSKGENAQSSVSSKDDHGCCSDYEYNYKSGQESMKYRYDHNSINKYIDERTKRMMSSHVGSNDDLLPFDKSCEILEERMRSLINERRISGISDFEFVKGDTFWQKSSLRAVDSEGYCLATASTKFSDFGLSREDFDPFKIEIVSYVRKTDDNISENGVHVGAHSASVEEYNRWLKSYIKYNKPTSYYEYPFRSYGKFIVVDDPDNYPDMYSENMCGSNSIGFILPKNYDVKKYAEKFGVGHCYVYGWSKGVAINYGDYVPVYTNTIDKMNQTVLDPEERNPVDKTFIGAAVSCRGEVFYRNVPKLVWVVQVDNKSFNQIERIITDNKSYEILKSIFVMTGKYVLTFDDILSAKKCFPEKVWSEFIGENEVQNDSKPVDKSVNKTNNHEGDMPSVW